MAELDNESPDMKRDAEVLKIIEEYATLDSESRDLSNRRSTLREKALKNHEITSHALQDAVYKLKRQTKAERLADERSTRMIVRAAEGRQTDLWPEETRRNEKRAADKRKREAEAAAAASGETPEQQERRLAADTKKRNDPKSGGAGKAKKKVAKELPPIVDDQRAAEQAEGDAVLSSMAPETEKLSQSAQSRAILAENGLDKA